jgi:hypothetical protein
LTRPPGKQDEQNVEKDGVDMEILQRMIKKLSNEIVDMKINVGEGTFNQIPYNPSFKIPQPYKFVEPPPINLNLDLGDVDSDSFFTYN